MTRRAYLVPIAILASVFQANGAERVVDRFPSLTIQGTVYPNACVKEERFELHQALEDGRVQLSSNAWRLIETLLCASDSLENRSYVEKAFPQKIRVRDESTGEKPNTRLVRRSPRVLDEVMAKGRAWQASIRVDGTRLVLQYYADEACIKGVTLANVNSQWMIYEIGGACD